MKIRNLIMAMLAILAVFAMLGCPLENSGQNPPPPVWDSAIPYDLHPLRTAVPQDFIRGADISNCLEIEEAGGVYRNYDGQIEDIMKILVDNGINYVRIRLWVDPSKDHRQYPPYPGDGNNHMGVTKEIAKRAKAAGMKFLLNYHYSDYWADPDHQNIPYAWKDLNRQDLLDALYDYTVDTIAELTAYGAAPDMVQLGNEIRSGLLKEHNAGFTGTGYKLKDWTDYSDALFFASKAVREAAPNAKIMIHFDNGGNTNILDTFANFTKRIDSGAAATRREVDYDVIGLSWYSIWTNHRTIDELYNNIRTFKTRYGKEVVVCETGYMWDIRNWDGMGNYAYTTQENGAANAFTNVNGFTSDSELEFAYRPGGATKYVPSTPENQARATRATMDAIAAAGGGGIMWWGADWIALPIGSGLQGNSEMAAIFESTGIASTNGKALPVIKVLGGLKGADTEKPGKIKYFEAVPDIATIGLTWTKVDAAVAEKYQLDRAASAKGPWTTLNSSLTDGSYSDTGVSGSYFYRVRAYNANGWVNYSDVLETATLAFVPAGISITPTIDTAALTWTALTGAAKYEVARAAAAGGPWTTVNENVAASTFTDTGLAPATNYYYRLRAYNTQWGAYSEPVATATLPLLAVENFWVTGAAESSYTLGWKAMSGNISGYEIHSAQKETEPADGDFTLLASPASADTSYTHSGLTGGVTYWYRIRGVYTAHGPGPWSPVRTFSLTATIDMATGTLDDDFLDANKASMSDDVLPKTDSAAVYTIPRVYVVNDETCLYVALDFGRTNIGTYNNDRMVVWVQNSSSSEAGLPNTDAGIGIQYGKIAQTQNLAEGTAIHAFVYKKMNMDNIAGTDGAAINIASWTPGDSTNDWLYNPAVPAGATVVKFSIPLANIAGAKTGDSLKVLAAHAMGWSEGSSVNAGSHNPKSAVTIGETAVTVTVDMSKALSYTVK